MHFGFLLFLSYLHRKKIFPNKNHYLGWPFSLFWLRAKPIFETDKENPYNPAYIKVRIEVSVATEISLVNFFYLVRLVFRKAVRNFILGSLFENKPERRGWQLSFFYVTFVLFCTTLCSYFWHTETLTYKINSALVLEWFLWRPGSH